MYDRWEKGQYVRGMNGKAEKIGENRGLKGAGRPERKRVGACGEMGIAGRAGRGRVEEKRSTG